MSGKLLTICHCEPSAARQALRLARNDKYLTGIAVNHIIDTICIVE
ncbi:hypothetical protein OSCI_2950003 [Kamptonema sp. PCC 6506]|nr:hypothetical protein OSCI_2950003 [Kamptonema sp. PCC 6506]